jgi:hypothetical protein
MSTIDGRVRYWDHVGVATFPFKLVYICNGLGMPITHMYQLCSLSSANPERERGDIFG